MITISSICPRLTSTLLSFPTSFTTSCIPLNSSGSPIATILPQSASDNCLLKAEIELMVVEPVLKVLAVEELVEAGLPELLLN